MLSSTNIDKYIKLNYVHEDVYDNDTQQTTNYTYISLECGQSNSNGVPMFPYYIESQRIATSLINSSTSLFIGVQQQGNLFDIDFEILS